MLHIPSEKHSVHKVLGLQGTATSGNAHRILAEKPFRGEAVQFFKAHKLVGCRSHVAQGAGLTICVRARERS